MQNLGDTERIAELYLDRSVNRSIRRGGGRQSNRVPTSPRVPRLCSSPTDYASSKEPLTVAFKYQRSWGDLSSNTHRSTREYGPLTKQLLSRPTLERPPPSRAHCAIALLGVETPPHASGVVLYATRYGLSACRTPRNLRSEPNSIAAEHPSRFRVSTTRYGFNTSFGEPTNHQPSGFHCRNYDTNTQRCPSNQTLSPARSGKSASHFVTPQVSESNWAGSPSTEP